MELVTKTCANRTREGVEVGNLTAMLLAALRDMQWRRRRLVIAIISTGLIFAMTLVLIGLSNGFRVEAQRSVDSMGVDTFLIKSGAAGPFLGATPFSKPDLIRVRDSLGVTEVVPLACAASTVVDGTSRRNVTVFGAPGSGLGMPHMSEGQAPSTEEQVAVSSTLKRHVGDEIQVGARTLRVVGIVSNSTTLAKTPNIFLTNRGVQLLAYNGLPLISSIAIKGTPQRPLEGFRTVDRAAGADDLLRPVKVASGSITIVAGLMSVVAVLIVGSVVYLSALERLRDFAVFKAIGVPTRSILAGLALQAVIVTLLAAVLGVLFSFVLAPTFPMLVVVPISAYLGLPLAAILIGVLASLAGFRRAVAVDPALAFGGP
jgi:putative ABC transport system permease protein